MLLFVPFLIEYDGSVLSSCIVALPVKGCGIVNMHEDIE